LSEVLAAADLEALGRLDTCTVANAIETFGRRLRNEGFTGPSVRCLTPQLRPAVGYAETLRIRSSSPPWERRFYFDRTGVGAFVGGVHAHILRALGCVGAITNGAVRDIPEVLEARLQLFAGNLSPSHAYVHIVDHGQPVTVAGLTVARGDLLHADQHGVVCIPPEVARQIPAAAAEMRRHEQRIREYCRSSAFSLEGLRAVVDGPPQG